MFMVVVLYSSLARADFIMDVTGTAVPPFSTWTTVFPNWKMLPTSNFTITECDDTACSWCLNAPIVGVTILNYGTASGGPAGDITGMYFQVLCGATNSGIRTLTYAGPWDVGVDTYHAWTWSGSLPWSTDPCGATGMPDQGCLCAVGMYVYTDIGSCPTDGATIELGPGYNDVNFGGITDGCGSKAPWVKTTDGNPKEIRYIVKEADKDMASPGDTINYRIIVGKPGTSFANIIVWDTQPSYTHLLPGSGAPAPDAGYDPDPGPPARLRWTLPGGTPGGGGTEEIRFALSIDWGNTEVFEPGSGDTAAPEGARLGNAAQAFWPGLTGCAKSTAVSTTAETIVKRFLFWKIADNDMLIAPRVGIPTDEITYSIFLRNLSPTRTWWDVSVWDTVPAEIDAWDAGYGLEDPCVGWTMTPSGCAAAAAGKVITGAKNTIMTWRLDMPPYLTIELRWKAKIRQTVTASATVVNVMGLKAYGKPGIVNGTGSSGAPVAFTHLAKVVLATTYISYVGYGATTISGSCMFVVAFYPLNKTCQFELRGLEYYGAVPFSISGGKSISIGCLIGDCLNGFTGNAGPCPIAAMTGGGRPGCKAERSPAYYEPTDWLGGCKTFPFNLIYKLTANSPVLWQLMTTEDMNNSDNETYAPSTTLTYTGFMHYFWRRTSQTQTVGYGESLSLINTGRNYVGSYDPALPTTVHLFKWDWTSLSWLYRKTYELDAESQAYDMGTLLADIGPWRSISSQAQLIVEQGLNVSDTLGCCCGCANNWYAFLPTRETGNVVSQVGTGTFYGLVGGLKMNAGTGGKVIVGNTGAVDATYHLYEYVPRTAAVLPMPTRLAGKSGTWRDRGVYTVPAGFNAPLNPRQGYAEFDGKGVALFKFVLESGGPIQVLAGSGQSSPFIRYGGGAVMHASNGSQSGVEFFLNHVPGGSGSWDECDSGVSTYGVNVYTPKTGTSIKAESENGGYNATYTTDGPDQCVAFLALTNPAAGTKRNYRLSSPTGGNLITHYMQCISSHRAYTAPFLATGVHYEIIAPPVVYMDEPFWITVMVVEAMGGVKDDYCGTSSFTSTDPAAKMNSINMDAYNYTWDSNISTATCKAAGCPDGCDNGVKVFVNVVLRDIGMQTITAADLTDGSIVGLTAVMVVGVDVKLEKQPKLALAASGDTVQFKICWSNYSSGSAITFVITDAVPVATTYVQQVASSHICGTTKAIAYDFAYSTSQSSAPPTTGWVTTTGTPVSNTYWLRWTIRSIDIDTTGCACFKVMVR